MGAALEACIDLLESGISRAFGLAQEARLYVSGFPAEVLEDLVHAWAARQRPPCPVYVVSAVPGNGALPEGFHRVGPAYLASARVGSAVYLVPPFLDGQVQESVRGSGGASLRLWEPGFPWRDCRVPGFSWNDLLEAWCRRVGGWLSPEEAEAIFGTLRADLVQEADRSRLLWRLIDSFAGTTIADLRAHVGLPKAGQRYTADGHVYQIARKLAREISRQGVASTFDAFAGSPQAASVARELELARESLLAAGGESLATALGCWRAATGGTVSPIWDAIDADLLASLVDYVPPRTSIRVRAVDQRSNGEILSSGPARILLRPPGEPVTARVVAGVRNLPGDVGLEAAVGQQPPVPLQRDPDDPTIWTGPIVIPAHPPGRRGHRIEVRGEPPHPGIRPGRAAVLEPSASTPVLLLVDGATAITQPVPSPRARGAEGAVRIPRDGSYPLQVIVFGSRATCHVDGQAVPGVATQNPSAALFRARPSIEDGSEVSVSWVDRAGNSWTCTVTFEVAEPARRSNSLTDLLVEVNLGNTPASKFRAAYERLSGSPAAPLTEGSLCAEPRPTPLEAVERMILQHDDGWLPVLWDTRLPLQHSRASMMGSMRCAGMLHPAWTAMASAQLPPLPADIREYVEARQAVLACLEAQLDSSLHRAGSRPANLARQALVFLLDPALVCRYLRAYRSMVNNLGAGGQSAVVQILRAFADAIVLFEGDRVITPCAVLLSPFHPVQLAKLYFTQGILKERIFNDRKTPLATRLLEEPVPSRLPVALHTLEVVTSEGIPSGDAHWWTGLVETALTSPSLGPGLHRFTSDAGLDVAASPGGLSPSTLLQVIRSYLGVHASRRRLVLQLQDGSSLAQVTQVLLALVSGDGAEEPTPLVGGLRVIDQRGMPPCPPDEPAARPLDWCVPAGEPSGTADIATMKPPPPPTIVSGGAKRAAVALPPLVRRALVDTRVIGGNVLQVELFPHGPDQADRLPSPGGEYASTVGFLENKRLPGGGKAWTPDFGSVGRWLVAAGRQLDPRAFIEWARRTPGTLLWNFRIPAQIPSRMGSGSGYYVLASVPRVLVGAIEQVLRRLPRTGISPLDALSELTQAGMVLADEFTRTGRFAEGALGVLGALRLMSDAYRADTDPQSQPLPAFVVAGDEVVEVGFILQLDPFAGALRSATEQDEGDGEDDATDAQEGQGVLGDLDQEPRTGTGIAEPSGRGRHADLLAVHLAKCGDRLVLQATSIESKFRSAPVGGRIDDWLEQARASATRLDRLVSLAAEPDGLPERSLLAEIVHLGLRVAAGPFHDRHPANREAWSSFEFFALTEILEGRAIWNRTRRLVTVVHGGETSDREIPPPADETVVLISHGDAAALLAGDPGPVAGTRARLASFLRATCPEREPLGPPVTAEAVPVSEAGEPSPLQPGVPGVRPVEPTPGTDISEQADTIPRPVPPRLCIGSSEVRRRWCIIGKLDVREEKVALDLDEPKAIGIFGYMGSGKSYLAGVIIEGSVTLMPALNGLPRPLAVVVFNYRRNYRDRFELNTLAEPNDAPRELAELASGYDAGPLAMSDVHVLHLPGELSPGRQEEYGRASSSELKFRAADLDMEDWELLMGQPSSDRLYAQAIRQALDDLRPEGRVEIPQVRARIGRLPTQSRAIAQMRLDFAQRYVDPSGTNFAEQVVPGRVLVIDLRKQLFDRSDALRFFLVCANQISRIQGQFNKAIVFDEAHEYLSDEFGEKIESRLRYMRHEGTSYIFATQDVRAIPPAIRRWIGTKLVYTLGTPQNAKDLVDFAPEFKGLDLLSLPTGRCWVTSTASVNSAFSRPRLVRIRPRVTRHGGATRIFS